MKRYLPDKMSRRALKRCYRRYSLSVILSIAAALFAVNFTYALVLSLFPALMADTGFYQPLTASLIDFCGGYLPPMFICFLLLRPLPRREKIEVNRLSLWELIQAAVFTFGVGYLTVNATNGVIFALQNLTGAETSNAIDAIMDEPLWLTFLFVCFLSPVFEEILYRKIILEPLRGLGDTTAVLLSALAFALCHTNLYQFGYAFVIGMVYAVIVLLTGSIRDTCLLHILFNTCNTLTWCGAPDGVVFALGLFFLFSMGACIPQFLLTRKNFGFESGPVSFAPAVKLRLCLSNVWFWVMLLGGIALSVCRIFL